MVNLPPDPNDRQSSDIFRDKDEAIAVAIAFLAIGAILLWGWTRGQRAFLPSASLPRLLEQPLVDDDGIVSDADDEGILARERRLERQRRIADAREDQDVEEERIVEGDREAEGFLSNRGAIPVPGIGPAEEALDTALGLDDEGVEPVEEDIEAEAPDVPLEADDIEVPEDSSDAEEPEASEGLPQPEDSAETDVPPPLDISDVSEGYWAYPYIVSLFDEGLLPDFPEGQVRPDQEMTRAELAALLSRSFIDADAEGQAIAFDDIPEGFWATEAISRVVDAGYMSGYPDNTFAPNELVPRYQVLVTLASGLGLTDPANPQEILSRFQGFEALPDWSFGQVAAAAENDIVVNHPEPEALAPQEPATRAEIIVMMHQALLNLGRIDESPADSPFVAPE